jgi:hypothetical protein
MPTAVFESRISTWYFLPAKACGISYKNPILSAKHFFAGNQFGSKNATL